MKDYHINIFYSQEDGGYIADIPDLPTAPLSARVLKRLLRRFSEPKPSGWRMLKPKASQFLHLLLGQ